ncbi:MAG: hypothetical protein DMG13_24250 [Acidobacteria bacterium]|nr:MAG: hypothetical protein DMG13_24250 [Acidobacteriota bacterium]
MDENSSFGDVRLPVVITVYKLVEIVFWTSRSVEGEISRRVARSLETVIRQLDPPLPSFSSPSFKYVRT